MKKEIWHLRIDLLSSNNGSFSLSRTYDDDDDDRVRIWSTLSDEANLVTHLTANARDSSSSLMMPERAKPRASPSSLMTHLTDNDEPQTEIPRAFSSSPMKIKTYF